jgi:hypothetical protein
MGLWQTKPAAPTPPVTDNNIRISVPMPAPPPPSAPLIPAITVVANGGWYKMIAWGVVLIGVAVGIYYLYKRITGKPTNLDRMPRMLSNSATNVGTDGKSGTVIEEGTLKVIKESDYTLQFWIYIKDWEYKYSEFKSVLVRGEGTPKIYLHPTDNKMMIDFKVYPSGEPAVGSTALHSDVFTCEVDDIPIQTWTSVSISLFQRNVDVYIGGKLTNSFVLSGIAKPSVGNIVIGPNGGFSGSICDVTLVPNSIGPIDAQNFHGAGSTCGGTAAVAADTAPEDTFSLKMFGYTFKFEHFENENKVKRNTW